MDYAMAWNGSALAQERYASYETYAMATSNELKVNLSFQKINSNYVNNRYCHSHWCVVDETDGVEVNHASWYYDDTLNAVVIINSIPKHHYCVYYGDIRA